jgi:GNAT superfamily N-acetyltransferase
MFEIRPYRTADEAAVREICMRTANAGEDARDTYQDQDLVPDLFAVPYGVLDAGIALVAVEDGRVAGYIVGTADTAEYVRQFRKTWLPLVADRHCAPSAEPDFVGDPDGAMASLLHYPEHMLHPDLAGYPAHLHIDLLPHAQGRGGGRALMHAFLAAVRDRGADQVFLSMLTVNAGARAFYDRLGFREIRVAGQGPDLTYLVRSTDAG